MSGFLKSAIYLLLTTQLALTKGVPATPKGPKPVKNRLSARKSVNDCEISTFVDQVSDASPLIVDCQQIAINIHAGGTWYFDNDRYAHQLVQYGTCAFDAQINGTESVATARIGNQDIIDLINDSITLFGWEGKVGTFEVTRCQTENIVTTEVIWGIYHT